MKVYTRRAELDAPALARLSAALEAGARIDHEGLVPVYDHGWDEGRLYLASEYVLGEDLTLVTARLTGVPDKASPAVAARVVGDLARAVQAVHAVTGQGRPRGADPVLRELGMGGVLCGYDGRARLADAGTVRRVAAELGLARPRSARGPLEVSRDDRWISPEEVRGAPLDARADVYALGVVLFELCTGQRHRPEGSGPSSSPSLATEEIERLPEAALAPRLRDVLLMALANDPTDRLPAPEVLARLLGEAQPPAAQAQVEAWMSELFGPRIGSKLEQRAALLDTGGARGRRAIPEGATVPDRPLPRAPDPVSEGIEPTLIRGPEPSSELATLPPELQIENHATQAAPLISGDTLDPAVPPQPAPRPRALPLVMPTQTEERQSRVLPPPAERTQSLGGGVGPPEEVVSLDTGPMDRTALTPPQRSVLVQVTMALPVGLRRSAAALLSGVIALVVVLAAGAQLDLLSDGRELTPLPLPPAAPPLLYPEAPAAYLRSWYGVEGPWPADQRAVRAQGKLRVEVRRGRRALSVPLFVDGQAAPDTPAELTLPVGSHELEVRPAGASALKRRVDVRADQSETLLLELDPR